MFIYLIQAIGIGFLAGFYFCFTSTSMLIIFIFGTAAKIGFKVNRVLLGISSIALFTFGLYQGSLGVAVIFCRKPPYTTAIQDNSTISTGFYGRITAIPREPVSIMARNFISRIE